MVKCSFPQCLKEASAICSCTDNFAICRDHIMDHLMILCGKTMTPLRLGSKQKILDTIRRLNVLKCSLLQLACQIYKFVENNTILSLKQIENVIQSLGNSVNESIRIQEGCLKEAEEFLVGFSNLNSFFTTLHQNISDLSDGQINIMKKTKIDDISEEIEQLKRNFVEKENEIEKLNTEIISYKSVCIKIEEYKEKFTLKEKDLEIKSEQLCEATEKLKISGILLEKANENLFKCKICYQEAELELQRLMNQCKIYENSIKISEEGKNLLAEKVKNAEAQIKELQETIKKNNKDLLETRESVSNLEAKNNTLEEDKKKVAEELKKVCAELSDSKQEVAKLKKDSNDIYLENQKKTQELIKVNEKISKLERELIESNNSLKTKTKEINTTKEELHKTAQELVRYIAQSEDNKNILLLYLHVKLTLLECLKYSTLSLNSQASILIPLGLDAEREWNYHFIKLTDNKKHLFICKGYLDCIEYLDGKI